MARIISLLLTIRFASRRLLTSWKVAVFMVESRFVEVDGIKTHYREAGEGPAILLLHGGEPSGGGGGSDTWPDEFLTSIAAGGYRAIAIDRLGQGETENPPRGEDLRISVSVKHSAAFIDALGLRSIVVGGQSRGGFVTLRIAQERPDLVAKTIIINSASISPRIPAEPTAGIGDLRYEVYEQQLNGDPRHDAEVMSVTTDHITDDWVQQRIDNAASPMRQWTRRMFAEQRQRYYAEFETVKQDLFSWISSGGYSKPMIIIWGVGDVTTTAEDSVELFRLFEPTVDNLRLYMINRSGHSPYREYPEETASQIVAFLDRP